MTSASDPRPPAVSFEDMVVDSAVLAYVLSECPDGISVPALAQAMQERLVVLDPDGDRVERAVRDLVGAGLLRADGALVKSGFRPV